jgi:hypothetical protein
MAKILKNNTASVVDIDDVGVRIPASGEYIIQSTDDLLFAGSSDLITLVGDSTLTINDGSSDLSITDGIDLIKAIFPKEIQIKNMPQSDIGVNLRRSDIQELKKEFQELRKTLITLHTDTFSINDGTGNQRQASVSKHNALKVVDQRIPSSEDPTLLIPLQVDFKNDSDSTDMRVDGSTTNVSFAIKALPDVDIFIDSISFRIADVNASANKFGNIAELTNGCQLIYSDLDNGEIIIGKELKTNFDFLRLCQGKPSFGSSNDALRIANASGQSEGYIPVLDFSEMFGLPWGVRLRAGSEEKLVIKIRDNTTTIDAFDAVAFGFKKLI